MKVFNDIKWNAKNVLRLIIPMILGFSMNLIPECRMSKNSGAIVKFRPPSKAFGIVWPILYILFGLSWIIASGTPNMLNCSITVDVLYIIITALLTLWIVVYSCLKNKKGGIYVITTCIGCIILTMNIVSIYSRLLLTPLITWLSLALLLNVFEVQLSK
jgi:tryptophan-rich sensory protein